MHLASNTSRDSRPSLINVARHKHVHNFARSQAISSRKVHGSHNRDTTSRDEMRREVMF